MKPVDRQKICSNCDGRIAVEADTCPYCGTPVAINDESSSAPAPLFDHQSINDSLSSLYSPPYSNKSSAFMKKEIPKPKMPTKESHENQLNASLGKVNYAINTPVEAEEQVQVKSSFWPLLLLLLGGNLLILGLLQFFFSERGLLRLEWESKYWFMYCLFALPILYFGFKKAGQSKEASQ